MTAKGRQDLNAAAEMQIDYIAISFVRSAADIGEARRMLAELNSTAGIITKIERAAIDVLGVYPKRPVM
ncbi:MAG: pyruvate kinase [Desulfobacterales bacterium]